MSKSRKRSAPAEARDERPRTDGVLRVTTGTLKLPEGLESDEEAKHNAMNRVAIVIVASALAFIAIIAWLVYIGQ